MQDCEKFEPNTFKKAVVSIIMTQCMFSGSVKLQEKCKHCGRSWTEHKGVISEADAL